MDPRGGLHPWSLTCALARTAEPRECVLHPGRPWIPWKGWCLDLRVCRRTRIPDGPCVLSCGSGRDLLTGPFSRSIPLRGRLSHPTGARRRVGQANHQGGRWTDEGGSIRAVRCAMREDRRPPDCVLHPGDRASLGKRWCSDVPFGGWKPDPGGPVLALLWFLPRLVSRLFVVRSSPFPQRGFVFFGKKLRQMLDSRRTTDYSQGSRITDFSDCNDWEFAQTLRVLVGFWGHAPLTRGFVL